MDTRDKSKRSSVRLFSRKKVSETISVQGGVVATQLPTSPKKERRLLRYTPADAVPKAPSDLVDVVPLVSIVHEDRKLRTVKASVPADIASESVEPYMQHCLDSFTHKMTRIVTKDDKYDGREVLQSSLQLSELPDLTYEIDSDFFQDEDELSEAPPEAAAQPNSLNVFDVFPVEPMAVTDPRGAQKLPPAPSTMQLVVKCTELDFKLGKVEPIFCSLCLFDAKKKQPISENYYFNFNDEFTLSLLGQTVDDLDSSASFTQAVFRLDKKSADYCLLLTVEKVLQGDVDTSIDTYVKYQMKQKGTMRANEQIRVSCNRLGKYKQLLCFGLVHLFNDSGQLIWDKAEEGSVVHHAHMELFAAKGNSSLQTYLKDKEFKKSKVIPANCTFDAWIVKGEDPLPKKTIRLDSSEVQVCSASGKKKKVTPQTMVQKEIYSFPESPTEEPHTYFANNLYIYPRNADLSSTSGRNVCVRIELRDNDATVEQKGKEVIFLPHFKGFTSSFNSTVAYHQKNPYFHDEVKMRLPLQLSKDHHLFFTFYHIKANHKDKKGKGTETTLGYSFLPVYPSGRILENGKHTLPIAVSLSENYLNPKVEPKWLDGKKDLFSVRSRLHSTVMPQDVHLSQFFKQFEAWKAHQSFVDESQFFGSITLANPVEVIHYFPVIITELLIVMCNSAEEYSRSSFFTLVDVLKSMRSLTRIAEGDIFKHPLLQQYVVDLLETDSIEQSNRPVFAEICGNLVAVIKNPKSESSQDKKLSGDLSFQQILQGPWEFSTFFFDLIIKTMALQKHKAGTLDGTVTAGNEFSKEYIRQLNDLIESIIEVVQELISVGRIREAGLLNAFLATFIKDLFSLLHRSVVFKFVKLYLERMAEQASYCQSRITGLRIICDSKHYVPLNSPVGVELPDPLAVRKHFFQRYYLAGFVLTELEELLKAQDTKSQLKLGVDLLRNLLRKHDMDPRYQDPKKKACIADMYFPLIQIVLDHQQELESMEYPEKCALLVCFFWVLKNCNRKLFRKWLATDTRKHFALFNSLSTCLKVFQYPGKEKILERWIEKHSNKAKGQEITSDQRKLYLESLYDKISTGESPLRRSSPVRSKNIIRYSKNKSDVATSDVAVTRSREGSASSMVGVRPLSSSVDSASSTPKTSEPNTGLSSTKRSRRGSISTPQSAFGVNLSESGALLNDAGEENTIKQKAYLNFTVSETILDLLKDITKDLASELEDPANEKMFSVVKLLVTLLGFNQPVIFLPRVLKYLESYVDTFQKILFLFPNLQSHLRDLTLATLNLANSSYKELRQEATNQIFKLIKMDYLQNTTIARMRLNMAIGVSKLVGVSNDLQRLQSSLKIINSTKLTEEKDSKFTSQLQEMLKRIFVVVDDSMKIAQHRFDPEMIADLYYEISNGYVDSPELRVTWLEHLYSLHLGDKHWEEAGQALICIAALVSEYLYSSENSVDITTKTFLHIAPNITNELALQHSAESQIHSKQFTEGSLLSLLRNASELFKKTELFELSMKICNIITHIQQHNRAYDKLIGIYHDLQNISKLLAEKQNARLFPPYYRVAFYGARFGEMNKGQFIYKELRGTIISDIVERLKGQYEKEFGPQTSVEFLPNINDDTTNLNPSKCYIQVVAVQPHFDVDDYRKTVFDRVFNIDRFIYETPFIKGTNKSQTDDLALQYKRKTFLKVEAPFPYLKKRIKIVQKQEEEIDPIHVAIEVIQRRCNAIATELNVNPPNSKTLQNVLQGSVLAQVNAGPIKICSVFLGEEMKYDPEAVAKLREAIDTFLELCGQAIELNGALISQEQAEFQVQLTQGYEAFKQEINDKYKTKAMPVELKKFGPRKLARDVISSSVRDLLHASKQLALPVVEYSLGSTEPQSEAESSQEE